MDHILDQNTQVILLLCGRFGRAQEEQHQPLSIREYNNIEQWLGDNGRRLVDLLDESVVELLVSAFPTGDGSRINYLLGRGGALALVVESWANRGIWLIGRGESGYPDLLKARLKNFAPPILYGVGDRELTKRGGLAVVGSRDVDDTGMEFTRAIAAKCAEQSVQIVSGGARGVDSEAMLSALSKEGTSVGVLAHSLARAAVAGKYREHILDGTLALISPYDPDSGFSIGAAMGRNKYIYCLSDWALVVSSTLERGGTWSGAVENIKRKWTPLFIRSGPAVPDGNQQLIDRGGIKLTDMIASETSDIAGLFEEHANQFYRDEDSNQGQQLSMF